jgi:serine/threonine-protein kinase
MTAGSPPSGTEVPISALVDRRYRVRREIARGGMGIVYEAEHTVLGDVVALKCLNSRAREVFGIEERLMREARALARARHPHVVAVRDAGICPSYGPYVALDRLEGRPLDGLLTAKTRL